MNAEQKKIQAALDEFRGKFEDLPPEEQQAIQKDFELLYGSNYQTRTRNQWQRLVAKYGIKMIMKQEGLTKAYIKAKLKPGKLTAV